MRILLSILLLTGLYQQELTAEPNHRTFNLTIDQFSENLGKNLTLLRNDGMNLIPANYTLRESDNQHQITVLEVFPHLRLAVMIDKTNQKICSLTLAVSNPSDSSHEQDFTAFSTAVAMTLNPNLTMPQAVQLLNKLSENPYQNDGSIYTLLLESDYYGLSVTKDF